MIEKKQGRRSAQDAQKTRYHIITIAAELFCEPVIHAFLCAISVKRLASHIA